MQIVRTTSCKDHTAELINHAHGDFRPDDAREEIKVFREFLRGLHQRTVRVHLDQNSVVQCREWG